MCRVRWIVIPTMILLIIGLSILHHWILSRIPDDTIQDDENQGFRSSKLTVLTKILHMDVQIGKLPNFSDPNHACYEPQTNLNYLLCKSDFNEVKGIPVAKWGSFKTYLWSQF